MATTPDPTNRVTEAMAVPVSIGSADSPFVNGYAPSRPPFGTGSPQMLEHEIPTPWYLDFSGVWRRHRTAFVRVAILSAIFGFVIGTVFSTKLWAIEGRMRFITPPRDGHEVYTSLQLLTYCDLVLSDPNLEKLAQEFRDRLPPTHAARYLKAQIKAEAPRNTDIIEVSMDAVDPELGVALVNQLMKLHIEYTNELRRTTTLRQSAGLLSSTIEKCDSQIRKWRITIEEYEARLRSGATLEKLDQVELDGTYSHRRTMLLEEIRAEQVRLSELESVRDQKLGEHNRQLELHRKGVGVPFEMENAREQLRTAENSVKLSRTTITSKQEQCRNLPLEYANMRITENNVQLREAQADLTELTEKMNSFGTLGAAGATADPADEKWMRLRRRLLGADAPEFDILKQATMPAYPSSSNRKMITAVGFAGPVCLCFLVLAYLDHRRGLSPAMSTQLAVIDHTAARPMPSGESPLLSSRFQQWLVEPTAPPPLNGSEEVKLENTPVDRPAPPNNSVNGDRASL